MFKGLSVAKNCLRPESVSLASVRLKVEYQKQPTWSNFRKRCSENMKQIYERTPMASVISIKLQSMEKLHPWLFSCKFSAYFQNNFS